METDNATEQPELEETELSTETTDTEAESVALADVAGDNADVVVDSTEAEIERVSETVDDSAVEPEVAVEAIDPTPEETVEEIVMLDETMPPDTADTVDSDTINEVVISIEKSVKPVEVSPDVIDNTANETAAPISKLTNEATPMANQSPNTPSPAPENMSDWIVMPESAWPPPIFIKKTATPNERFYLTHRWHSQWSYYDSKATQNKNTYYSLQRVVVIGSLIIPALVSLNSAIARFITNLFGGDAAMENNVRIGGDFITVIISLAVAGAASLESLYKFGENWSSYRSAAEELQAEKNYYDMGAGSYVNNPSPFATFVERVEGVVANQNGKYFQAVQKQLQKQEDQNEEIIASFKSGDDDDEYALSVQRSTSTPASETETSEEETVVG